MPLAAAPSARHGMHSTQTSARRHAVSKPVATLGLILPFTAVLTQRSPPESPWHESTGCIAGQTCVGGKGCCPAQIMAGVMAAPGWKEKRNQVWSEVVVVVVSVAKVEHGLQPPCAPQPGSAGQAPTYAAAGCRLLADCPTCMDRKPGMQETASEVGPTNVQVGRGARALVEIHNRHSALRRIGRQQPAVHVHVPSQTGAVLPAGHMQLPAAT